MASTRNDFALCETVAGALHMICEAYGMDGCWLPWQYEKHILTGGASPFRITTGDYPRNIKDGVSKVSFETHFDQKQPNLVKYIRFDELPGKGKYMVTQTSLKHLNEGGASCPLWIEIPKGADREGISGVQSLLKAEICCAEWKDFLGPSPETAIERAHLVIAQGDIDWLKRQVVFKDNNTNQLTSAMAFSRIEVAALRAEIGKLNVEVAKTNMLREKIEELKAELKAASKANDKLVEDLEAQLKSLNTNVEKLQGTMKGKSDTISKLRRDLKAKGEVSKGSDPESPTPADGKKRKIAPLKTPKRDVQFKLTTPNTAPAQVGPPSTPYTVSSFNNAAFTHGDSVVASRTRGARMASFTLVDDTPVADTPTQARSVISLSSSSGADGAVFND